MDLIVAQPCAESPEVLKLNIWVDVGFDVAKFDDEPGLLPSGAMHPARARTATRRVARAAARAAPVP